MRLPELMDDPALEPAANRRALADLDRVNLLLLGDAAVRRVLAPRLMAAGGDAPWLLDIGSGSGRTMRRVARHVGRRGKRVEIVAVDRKLAHLNYADPDGALRVVADARALPFRDAAVDWAAQALLFHHFGLEDNHAIVGEMLRVARYGAVLVDLRRSRLAGWLLRLLFALLKIGRVATLDGRRSVAQAWSIDEVEGFAVRYPNARVEPRFPFRFSLVATHEAQASPCHRPGRFRPDSRARGAVGPGAGSRTTTARAGSAGRRGAGAARRLQLGPQ